MPFDADVVEGTMLRRGVRFNEPDITAERYPFTGNNLGYSAPEPYAG